jgi:hypothetical protein
MIERVAPHPRSVPLRFAASQNARSLVLVDELAPCPAQRVELQGKVLVVGRNAGIADHHGRKIPLPEFCPTLLPCSSLLQIKGLETCGRRDKRVRFIQSDSGLKGRIGGCYV